MITLYVLCVHCHPLWLCSQLLFWVICTSITLLFHPFLLFFSSPLYHLLRISEPPSCGGFTLHYCMMQQRIEAICMIPSVYHLPNTLYYRANKLLIDVNKRYILGSVYQIWSLCVMPVRTNSNLCWNCWRLYPDRYKSNTIIVCTNTRLISPSSNNTTSFIGGKLVLLISQNNHLWHIVAYFTMFLKAYAKCFWLLFKYEIHLSGYCLVSEKVVLVHL